MSVKAVWVGGGGVGFKTWLERHRWDGTQGKRGRGGGLQKCRAQVTERRQVSQRRFQLLFADSGTGRLGEKGLCPEALGGGSRFP